jgi:myosin heavy subunit
MFTWLVKRINESLDSKFNGRKTVMGLLDIYGFEIMHVNRSFYEVRPSSH